MNSYELSKFCSLCRKARGKELKNCPDCGQRLRTKPKGQYAKKHPQLVRY
jgi:hypothetical protein